MSVCLKKERKIVNLFSLSLLVWLDERFEPKSPNYEVDTLNSYANAPAKDACCLKLLLVGWYCLAYSCNRDHVPSVGCSVVFTDSLCDYLTDSTISPLCTLCPLFCFVPISPLCGYAGKWRNARGIMKEETISP